MKDKKFNLLTFGLLLFVLMQLTYFGVLFLFNLPMEIEDFFFIFIFLVSLVFFYFASLYLHEFSHYFVAKLLKYEEVSLQARGLRFKSGKMRVILSEIFYGNSISKEIKAEGYVTFKPKFNNIKKDKIKLSLVLLAGPLINFVVFILLIQISIDVPILSIFQLGGAVVSIVFVIASMIGDFLMIVLLFRKDYFYYYFSITLYLQHYTRDKLKSEEELSLLLQKLQQYLDLKREKAQIKDWLIIFYGLVQGSFLMEESFFTVQDIQFFLIEYERSKKNLNQVHENIYKNLVEMGVVSHR
ncbi:MAG: hypothetical protein FWG67_03145 [Defluviitaleaceae bacterium]|nr:hypothetical protein [Defluviitaleaceae bacterium]